MPKERSFCSLYQQCWTN